MSTATAMTVAEDEQRVTSAARAAGLVKVYGTGETRVTALDEVDVAFDAGRFTAIMGASGSGKSTLMQCVAGLDTVTAGQIWIGDTEITRLRDKQLTRLRRGRSAGSSGWSRC